ncbi:neuraminidase-like domain-containing protein [Pseudomonas sp. S3E12]|uniref:Tc toxin subunit A-related protein n=1 Tax=Pseudomonas sp. S3E12 TaxID=1873126 RepID=UPI00081BDDDE|nr:neuraminidase-like domain-containing protein [Pseudomonas sp. S3E12]OCW26254.1 hypothetical protein BB029_06335 [Pseudomonas sp. S3E12]
MSKSIDCQLNETLRDVLVAYYLNVVVPNTQEFIGAQLSDKLKTANDLYEYKLLDVLVSQDVTTSPVASAIASLQQYINGALMGMEPGYETRVMEEHLITQWREINSQYPIWAANQQLQYYPEVYIDPSLRLSKSTYFQQLENDINQNKIHIDTTQEAVLSYLASFEEVANLTIINGYINTDDFKNGLYYFIGKSRAENAYYWRSVDMSQRTYKDLSGSNPNRPKFDYPQPGAWSDWHKAALPISASAIERTIRPVVFNNRLFVFWVECVGSNSAAVTVEQGFLPGTPKPPDPGSPQTQAGSNPMLRLNLVYKKYDDSWSVPQTVIEAWSEAPLFKSRDLPALVESIAVADSSASPESMLVAMYAGYESGASVDGTQDKYAFLRTAWIDKNFNVTPLFPERGVVLHVGVGDGGIKKPYVLKAARIFVLDNYGRFQFKLPAFMVAVKSVETSSPHTSSDNWNYMNWQNRIFTPRKGTEVRYNVLAQALEFESKLVSSVASQEIVTRVSAGLVSHKFTLVLVTSPSMGGGENVTLLKGSTMTVEGGGFSAVNNNVCSFSLQTSQIGALDYYLRDSDVLSTCSLPALPSGASVSLEGKRIFKAALSLLSPDNAQFVTYFYIGFAGGSLYSYHADIIQQVHRPLFQSLILRPVDVKTPTPAFPGERWLFYSTTVSSRLPPDTQTVSIPINPETLLPDWNVDWPVGSKKIPLIHGLKAFDNNLAVGHTLKLSLVELELVPAIRTPLIAPRISTRASPTLGIAEFIDFTGSGIHLSDDASAPRQPIRMNTLFARELIQRANIALENLLTWETQGLEEPPLQPPAAVNRMDFHGANGKYFWELFLHLPFLVSQRLNLELQFDEAERWLGFIFDPSRKQDSKGRPDYWNVRPLMDGLLQMDHATRKPADPDGIASSHPVRYRKAIYLHYLKNLLDRGDAAYRQLTPDSLGEAKLWYVRVLDLLGPRPDIKLVDSWTPVTLQVLSNSTNTQLRTFEQRLIEQDHLRADSAQANEGHSLYQFAEPPLYLRTFSHDPTLADLDSDYLRLPINAHLVKTWDIAESRLDNLRNSRTLDGKPLSLPLFAAPLNPRDLLAAFGQGAAAGGSARLLAQDVPHYRFSVMHERALNAVQTLTQFGGTLLSLIERKEQAQFEALQYRQAWDFAQFSIDLQQQAQVIDKESQKALEASRAIVQQRLSFYAQLADEVVNSGERAAAGLHLAGRVAEGVGAISDAVAGGLVIPPNAAGGGGGAIVGFANGVMAGAMVGGWRLEGVPQMVSAAAFGLAALSHNVADALDRTEQFRRRHQEWTFARDQAALEIEQIDAQLNVLRAQSRATALQLQQAEVAQAHALATYAFLGSRFSNVQLYQWLNGQFATFYYQTYDAALALCLAAEACWQFETADYASRFIQTGAWNDSYRGLGAGESLGLQLLKMEAAYLSRNDRHLEITKTVSLRQLPDRDPSSALNQDWATTKLRLVKDGRVEFELTQGLLDSDYPGHILRRIQRVSVSLPVTVGPYEDIRATLTQTYSAVRMADGSLKENLRASQQVALSAGIDDDGLFTFDFNDVRYLPFEGTGAVSRWLLHFPNHDRQRSMLESLTDIIVHLRYTARAAP